MLIIGGGPAGLSAALMLGRCRRRVLICDHGQPRNAASLAMHGFLTRDGIAPVEFLRIGREQLRTYPDVEFRHCEVTAIERRDRHFTAQLGDGSTESGRILLFATGIADELPPLPGIERFYGRSVHHCPYCDGWEHRDEPLAVFGSDADAVGLALELLVWSQDIVLCSHGPLPIQESIRLGRFGIRVETALIERLEGEGDALRGIVFEGGRRLERTALFFSPAQHPRSDLGVQLGCKALGNGQIDCAESQRTNIEGVFAVGNASPGLQLVIIAAAEGTRAAFEINHALHDADLAGHGPAR